MKVHIYLFRHGQTTFNRDKKFTGWLDSKLTPLGKKQAQTIAKKLKNKQIDVAVQTTLSRSKDTLKYVLKYHPECRQILNDNRMIERHYGKLQGLSHDAVIKKYSEKQYETWHRSYSTPPPKGESIKMVERRVNSFIKDLLIFVRKYGKNVAISAHGNSMRPFRKYFEKLSNEKMMKLENPWDDYFEYTINVK